MFLILDTNILFAFLHPKPGVRRMFKALRHRGISLVVPQHMFNELLDIKPDVLKYCSLTEREFSVELALMLKQVKPEPKSKYMGFMPRAREISPHLNDAPLFALSLALDKSPIWSREPRLKRQKHVRVLDDKEVGEFFDIDSPS